jgi:hypothetical protein
MTDMAHSTSDEQQAPMLPVSYRPDTAKLLWCLIGCIAFVAIGLWLISQPPTNFSQKAQIAGWSALIFFGFGAVVMALVLGWQPRIITLQEDGLLVGESKRWIAWKDIIELRLIHQQIPGFFGASSRDIVSIGIFVKDPSAYYSSWGPIGRWLCSITDRKFGTPILISCNLLPVDPDTFIEWLNEYRAKYAR